MMWMLLGYKREQNQEGGPVHCAQLSIACVWSLLLHQSAFSSLKAHPDRRLERTRFSCVYMWLILRSHKAHFYSVAPYRGEYFLQRGERKNQISSCTALWVRKAARYCALKTECADFTYESNCDLGCDDAALSALFCPIDAQSALSDSLVGVPIGPSRPLSAVADLFRAIDPHRPSGVAWRRPRANFSLQGGPL